MLDHDGVVRRGLRKVPIAELRRDELELDLAVNKDGATLLVLQHATVLREVEWDGRPLSSLDRAALQRRAATISKAADAFTLILKFVRPKLAFVVTYYAGLAPAFLLACRRLGILSVDLQRRVI